MKGNGSNNSLKKKLETLRTVHMSTCLGLSLFFWKIFCCCFGRSGNKLHRLYTRGKDRLSKEMDLVGIVKSIRRLKIMQSIIMKNQKITMRKHQLE